MRIILILLLSIYIHAASNTKLKIRKDVDKRASVLVVDTSGNLTVAKKIYKIFTSDLKISGHFLPAKGYKHGSYDNTISPNNRSKEYLIKYRYAVESSGGKLSVKLLRGSDSKLMLEKKYTISSIDKYPFISHRAVTDINKALGFNSIEWINRYVVFAKYTGRKQSEILLSDYTFNYIKTIVRGGLNLFPQWADPKQKGFYYTSYESGLPTLYHLNIYTGSRKKIASSSGMLVCSDVSSDGSKILLTMAPDNQPDIYELNVNSGSKKRITTFRGIDVNGKYSNSENSVVFVSNRMGRPNIYKKKIGSSVVRQVVFHGRKNNSCDIKGKKIIYSSKEGSNKFNIYSSDISTGSVRPLTSTGVNQFPRFAPDGNTILYIKRNRGVNSVGYIGLLTNQTMLFPLGAQKIQSIDW